MKKYKLTKEKKQVGNITLYRIKAIKDFGYVKKGELGGWVESESNLSHNGNAWVYENAEVYENAKVYGDAEVYGDAWVYGDAMVYGNAMVCGDAMVSQQQVIKTGWITKSLEDLRYSIIVQLGIVPDKKFVLYKRVNKIKKGEYQSLYDKNFKYYDGKIAKVKNYDKSNKSCSSGIHLSNPLYWEKGDTLIACEVNFKDVITCQEGKVRVKKCKVIGEVKI